MGNPSTAFNRPQSQFWQIPFKALTHGCIWSHSSALGSLHSSLYSRTVPPYLDNGKLTDKNNNITMALISCSATKASRASSSAKRTGSFKLVWLELANSPSSWGSLSSQQPRVMHGVWKLWQPNTKLEDLEWLRDGWSAIERACQDLSTRVCISYTYTSPARRYTCAKAAERHVVALQYSYVHD